MSADPRATLAVAMHALAAVTAGTATGSSIDLHEALEDTETLLPRSCVRLFLDVTAVAGTSPTLAVTLETSRDGTIWRTLDTFATVTAVSSVERLVTGASRYIRAKWTVGGSATPSVTFQLSGDAYLVYAAPSDVKRLALPSKAITAVLTDAILGEQILAACDEVDEITDAVFAYPIASWGPARTMHVAWLAAYTAMRFQGYQPAPQQRDVFKEGRDAAIAWAEQTRDQKRAATSTTDATPTEREGGVHIVTRTKRGW